MHKQMWWFDRKNRAPGVLANVLSEDIANLNALTTESVGVLTEAIVTLLAGCAMSFYFEWRMALFCLLAIPFVVLGGVL